MFRLKSVDEMDPDMVLEVPDTPDRLMRVKVTSSPCQRNVEVPDTPDRLMRVKAAASSSSERNAEYSEHIYSRHHNSVGNSVNKSRISPHDTEELFKRAKLALSISDAPQPSTTPKTKQNGVVTEGKESRKNVDNHNNPLHTSYLTRCGDARRNSGKEPLNEDSELLGHHRKSELFVVGSSSPTSSVGKPQSQFSIEMSQTGKAILQDEKHVNIKSTDKGKGTQPCNDSQPKSEHTMSNTLPTDITWRSTGRRRLVRNGVISPCNTENNNFQSKLHHGHAAAPSVTRPCSSLVGINSHDNSEEAPLSEIGDRNKESRGVLHNANPDYRTIRKLKQDKVESVVLPGAVNGLNSISHVIGSAGNNCNGKYDYSKKGKAIVDSNVVNEQDGKIALHPHRTHRRAETEMTVTGGASCHASIAEDPDFCAVNLSEKPSIFSSSGAFNIHKTKEMPNKKLESRSGFANVLDNSKTTMFPESNSNREQTISELISETRRKVTIKGKRKYSSTVDSTGQQSKSDFENSEILCLGTSQQALNSRSSRSRTRQRSNIVLGPIIEVDELHSPEAASSNPPLGSPEVSLSANARIRQVESDEILARRLQEQLYNESPEIGTNDEIDAAIALSLQEESIRHTSSASRQSRRNGIDAAIALSLQEGSVRRTSSASRQNRRNGRERFIAHLRSQLASRNARYRSSTGIARLMRDIDLQGMDMDMRLDLFEELEVAFDNSNTSALSHILQVQRDFNENDYETLLALDDNNHQHLGASETQINNLPQSVMQTNNVEEPCAICLENPSVGDIIRHLPCLHKFHKDCIDQWLRRKISCPVCKTDIT